MPTIIGGTVVVDATTGAKGIVQLAGDLAGTAAAPTVPGKAPLLPEATTTANTAAVASSTLAGKTNRFSLTAAATQPFPTLTDGTYFAVAVTAGSTASLTLTLSGTDVFGDGSSQSMVLAPGDFYLARAQNVSGVMRLRRLSAPTYSEQDTHNDVRYPAVSGLSAAAYSLLGRNAANTAQAWFTMPQAIARALGWFVVTTYGAVGDGVTDDTAAIQNAMTAAAAVNGTVVFPNTPSNTWMVTGLTHGRTGSVRLHGQGISYVGGYVGTRIKRLSGTSPVILAQGIALGGANPYDPAQRTRIELYDLELHGNDLAGEVLTIFRGQQFNIERVRVRSSTVTAVHLTQAFNCTIRNLFVGYSGSGTTYPAMVIDGTAGEGTVAGTNTLHLTDIEFETNNGIDLQIDGSSADSAPSAGIFFSGVKMERDTGNYRFIDLKACNGIAFSNIYASLNTSGTAELMNVGTTSGSVQITNAKFASAAGQTYWVVQQGGHLQYANVSFAGNPATAYTRIESTTAYNAHDAQNVYGDQPSKLYSDARGTAGRMGSNILNLPVTHATATAVVVGAGAGGWGFSHTSSTPYVEGSITVPPDSLVTSASSLVLRWAASSAGAGNVRWTVIVKDDTTGSDLSVAGTTTTVTAATTTSALKVIESGPGPGFNINPGHVVRFRAYRDGTHATDTYADDAYLLGIDLLYRRQV